VLGDWEKPYLTMDFRVEADIVRSLARIVANGHLYRGSKPVYWCIDSVQPWRGRGSSTRTAIPGHRRAVSSGELRSVAGRCRHVEGHEGKGPLSVVIWTTTPWTLPANRAVAVNPGFEYVVVQVETDHVRNG